MSDRPNIVIFNPDQWRGDTLGYVGNPAAVTPNLDRMVQSDGVGFARAFCQNPVCTPSRCSFMTGWYPHTRGHRTMHYMLRQDEPVLLRTLKRQGYFVWWGGKNDLVPGQHGFEHCCHVKHRATEADFERWGCPRWTNREQALGRRGKPGEDTYYSFYRGRMELEHHDAPGIFGDGDWGHVLGACDLIRNRPDDRPMCIYLPLGFPHPPYVCEDPYYSLIDRAKVPPRAATPEGWAGKPALLKGIAEMQALDGWSEERWTELRATYYAMCARVDHQFGLVMDALREAGIYDETAVFFFADHGDFTGDYGLVEKTQNTFEDCLSRVPFVVKPPAGVPVMPRVTEALVELIDMPATVEAFTGVAPGHTHFGRPLLPVLSGETEEHRDAVFCEGGRIRGERQAMELPSTQRLGDASVSEYWPRIRLQQQDDGPEHTKAVMCRTDRYKYVRRLYESDELYDLGEDPQERVNRIDDPALAEVRDRLAERMLTWFFETGDVVPFDPDKR